MKEIQRAEERGDECKLKAKPEWSIVTIQGILSNDFISEHSGSTSTPERRFMVWIQRWMNQSILYLKIITKQ